MSRSSKMISDVTVASNNSNNNISVPGMSSTVSHCNIISSISTPPSVLKSLAHYSNNAQFTISNKSLKTNSSSTPKYAANLSNVSTPIPSDSAPSNDNLGAQQPVMTLNQCQEINHHGSTKVNVNVQHCDNDGTRIDENHC